MNLQNLKTRCKRIEGVHKVRINRYDDAVFIYFKPLFGEKLTSGNKGREYKFKTVVHLDNWQEGITLAKREYERFFIRGEEKNGTYSKLFS